MTKAIFLNRYFYPDHSATAQLLADLVFHVAERREVHVVASRQIYDDPNADLDPSAEIRGVKVHRVKTSRRGRGSLVGRASDQFSFHASAARKVAGLARRGDVVVALTDPPLLSVALGPVVRLRGARLINWLQDVYPETAEALGISLPGGAVLTRLRNRSLRGAQANVAIGERMAARLKTLGAADGSVVAIPNWADDQAIRPQPVSPNPLRTEWGLEGKFVVGYSGNLGRAHEIETVIAAAALLRGRPDVVFLFIGDGFYRSELEARALREGLTGFVFKPYQPLDLLNQSLAVADVHWVSLRPALEGLIVPSKFYGIAAAGRPMIVAGLEDGELAELVKANQCGLVVAVGQGETFAAAVVSLADDPQLRLRMGQRAREMLERHFSRRLALQRWSDLIDKVAA